MARDRRHGSRRRRAPGMGLREDLGPGPTALDTAAFIYYIEENEAFLPLVAPIFEDVAAGRREVVTSSLTLLEVLVVPFRAGNLALADRYEACLSRSRGVRLLDIGRAELRMAAQLRALHPTVRTPDALQLAAGLSSGCRSFVTNDRNVPSVAGLKVLQLRSYL
jgi:predicted nucleic acid-binding protein